MTTTQKSGKVIAERTEMPCLDPAERSRHFGEVALGYTRETAVREAARCLQCKKPRCITGCPVEVPIKDFIAETAKGDMEAAYRIIAGTNCLPAVCGRVCPQENQCEGKCILAAKGRAVCIGRLERYVADTHMQESKKHGAGACAPGGTPKYKVACIGSGPASVTAAGLLAARGIGVDVYEALHEPGGVLVYGIPAFRLPKDIVAQEIDGLRALGVRFLTNWVGGRTFTVSELLEQRYNAVFIGVGAGLPLFLGIPGENLVGVFSANEYLTRMNLGRAHAFPEYDTPVFPGKHVTVFGAGNVAMDAARTAIRQGAETVRIVYRRTREEMPARHEEIEHAVEEGVRFELLAAPLSFAGNAEMRLKSVKLQRMRLGEPDASGRRKPEAIPGDCCELETDMAIVALGAGANPLLTQATPGLKLNRRGYIEVDEESGETSLPNVFAGGDIVTGAATVILAMGAGRRAAQAIARRLLG